MASSMAMAFEVLSEKQNTLKKLETPWRSFRKLLLHFRKYLRNENKENDFKYFTYLSVPAKNLDYDVVILLIKLEQSDMVSMDNLELLCDFLVINNDSAASRRMLSIIREFQLRLMILGIINDSDGGWIHSSFQIVEKFSISNGLDVLLKKWKQEIEEAPNLSLSVIQKLNSEATQRVAAQVASEKQGEALVIAKFLAKSFMSYED